jgi:hypothetical protein
MTSEPQWETTEHGWHAVASLSKGYQWTAYIEYVDASYWRIWAGRMFVSLRLAQEWCRAEITHQVQRLGGESLEVPAAAEEVAPESEPTAWDWLWLTLHDDLGKDRLAQIQDEFTRRLQQEQTAKA